MSGWVARVSFLARCKSPEHRGASRGTKVAVWCAMLRQVQSGSFPRLRSFAYPSWRAAVLVGCVASLSLACGGKSDSDVFDDGNNDGTGGTASGGAGGTAPTGGSNGNGNSNGTSETNGSGGSGGSGGTQGTSGGNGSTSVTSGGSSNVSSTVGTTNGSGTTGSGGGPSDDRCLLPFESGPCEGAFGAFGYNAETGRCEEFIWGGCGGNENRFDSLEACLNVCDPGGRTACESTAECVVDHGCCGFCGMDHPDQLVAVNAKYGSFTAPQCALVDCAQCTVPEQLGHFGARCNEGTCEIYDVRKSDLSACETDADCRLRAGLSCCESCGETNWVAVSTDRERVEKELCGDMPAGCPACAPIEPVRTFAACSQGHCQVQTLLL